MPDETKPPLVSEKLLRSLPLELELKHILSFSGHSLVDEDGIIFKRKCENLFSDRPSSHF